VGVKQGLGVVNCYQTQTFTTMFLVYILENITIKKCEYLWQVYCHTSFWGPKWHLYKSDLASCLWFVTYDSRKL